MKTAHCRLGSLGSSDFGRRSSSTDHLSRRVGLVGLCLSVGLSILERFVSSPVEGPGDGDRVRFRVSDMDRRRGEQRSIGERL